MSSLLSREQISSARTAQDLFQVVVNALQTSRQTAREAESRGKKAAKEKFISDVIICQKKLGNVQKQVKRAEELMLTLTAQKAKVEKERDSVQERLDRANAEVLHIREESQGMLAHNAQLQKELNEQVALNRDIVAMEQENSNLRAKVKELTDLMARHENYERTRQSIKERVTIADD